jgi:hypothetical protein
MAAKQQMTPAQAQSQNAQARYAMLTNSPRYTKKLGTYSANAGTGATTRVKLQNVGIITKLRLYVTANVTIAVANAVQSTKGPYNLIDRIRLADFANQDRVNCSGFQLWEANCVRNKTFFGANNEAATAVFTNPSYPVATGNKVVSFFIDVPVAYDAQNPIVGLQDLRGAILAQTGVGELYLTIDWLKTLVSNAGDIDALYSGAGTTTVVGTAGVNDINVTVWQEYIFPQAIPGTNTVPMPMQDLMTVYELNGYVKSSDNLAVNQEKLINVPNVRSVIGAYYNYVTAGAAAQGNVAGIRFIANGNNVITEDSELSALFRQRCYLNSDLVVGAYFSTFRERPIETSLYGNVQIGFTPAVVGGGNQYVELMWEDFYVSGAALPGVLTS